MSTQQATVTDGIYQAPDIRKQKLEDAEEFLENKRVQRMVIAATYQQTVAAKAQVLHGKEADKFRRQADAFDAGMLRLTEAIEKLQDRLNKMNDINTALVNVEGVLKDAGDIL